MPFEINVPEDWRSAVIVPLHKTEFKNYICISLLRVVKKIYYCPAGSSQRYYIAEGSGEEEITKK